MKIMDFNFAIPLTREDLLAGQGDQYVVKVTHSRSSIEDASEVFDADVGGFKKDAVICHFDVLYSAVKFFDSISPAIKKRLWNSLCTCIRRHLEVLVEIFEQDELQYQQQKFHRNLLKMEGYALTQLAECFETSCCKEGEVVTLKKGRKKKKDVDTSNPGIDWDLERQNCLTIVCQLFQLDIRKLWDPPTVEDDFTNMFASICYKALQDKSTLKNKDVKDTVFNFLGILIKRYNHGLEATFRIVQLVQQYEHLPTALSEAIELFVTQFGAKNIVHDIIREVSKKDFGESSRDTIGARITGQFIVDLASRVPQLVLPNISLLLFYLGGEPFTLRNAMLSAITELVIRLLTKEDLEPSLKGTRDQFLDTLEDHLHDISAFVRCKTLQLWHQLCQEKAIPLHRHGHLLELVVGRLKDKSSQVRKYTIQFLKTFLRENPYGAELSAEFLSTKITAEKKKMEELLEAAANCNAAENTKETQKDTVDTLAKEMEEMLNIEESGESAPSEIDIKIKKQQIIIDYLEDASSYVVQMGTIIPLLCQLLGSKVSSDVMEAIDFFVAAYEFGLSGAHIGVRRMLTLVWSKDPGVKDAVLQAYKSMYIDKVLAERSKSVGKSVADKFLALANISTSAELASLEELLSNLTRANLIPDGVIQYLWQVFSQKVAKVSSEESRAAVLLLGMFASAERSIIKSNLDVLCEHGLSERGGEDLTLAANTCFSILKLAGSTKSSNEENGKEAFRLEMDHEVFCKLQSLLVNTVKSVENRAWMNFAELAIKAIYQLSENPDKRCLKALQEMTLKLLESTTAQTENGNKDDDVEVAPACPASVGSFDSKVLARVLSVAGDIAFQQMYHLDVSVLNELKRRNRVQQDAKNSQSERSNRRKSGRKSMGSSSNPEEGLADELGVGGASADDAEAEFIRKVLDNEVVTGENFLAHFGQLVVYICSNFKKYEDPELVAAAALCLSKFMLVSSEFCDSHLQLLFTMLEKSPVAIVRANAIIALGDLTIRFPNLIEPWTSHLYARLRDPVVRVRQTTVTVLTHLILNDIIKVKGQISEMALCLEDTEKRIADLTKLFFSELGQKENALYNVIPDIISRLSDPENGIRGDKFKSIMKYLLGLINKDKHLESLVERFCHRFRATRTLQQWRELAFCLSLVPFNEKCLKKFFENLSCYQDKLSDDEIYGYFTQLLSKAKKLAKQEIKDLANQIEERLNEIHKKGASEEDGVSKQPTQPLIADKGNDDSQMNVDDPVTPEKASEKSPVVSSKKTKTPRKGRRLRSSIDKENVSPSC